MGTERVEATMIGIRVVVMNAVSRDVAVEMADVMVRVSVVREESLYLEVHETVEELKTGLVTVQGQFVMVMVVACNFQSAEFSRSFPSPQRFHSDFLDSPR